MNVGSLRVSKQRSITVVYSSTHHTLARKSHTYNMCIVTCMCVCACALIYFEVLSKCSRAVLTLTMPPWSCILLVAPLLVANVSLSLHATCFSICLKFCAFTITRDQDQHCVGHIKLCFLKTLSMYCILAHIQAHLYTHIYTYKMVVNFLLNFSLIHMSYFYYFLLPIFKFIFAFMRSA